MVPTDADVPAIHAELERARAEFRELVRASTPAGLARRSNGTRWSNRELLFHMLFGYLITRNLRIIVKIACRLPDRAQHRFAAVLDAAERPFHQVNYWGSRAGGRALTPTQMAGWMDRVIGSLHRNLEREDPAALRRTMAFPTRWDPYFTERMTLANVYHYSTQHFDHHRQQLTLGE